MAAEEDVSALGERIDKLSVSATTTDEDDEAAGKIESNAENGDAKISELRLWGFEIRELYKLAHNFYKEKEGKAVHLSSEDKLKLMAFTQQVTHGKWTSENASALGVLDVIEKNRAWQNLGDISKKQAMEDFIVLLDKLCPLFRIELVEAQKRDFEEKQRLKKEEEAKKLDEERKMLEEERKKQEEKKLKWETQRRQIQDALNQKTYHQFKVRAEKQYPGNPEQQGVLIRQLQEEHYEYHNYVQLRRNEFMQLQLNEYMQLQRNQLVIEDQTEEEKKNIESEDATCKDDDEDNKDDTNKNTPLNGEDSNDIEDRPFITSAEMWTRNNVEEFKQIIRRKASDASDLNDHAVIKVGRNETLTVRVSTHEDGTCLFWEFATDGYDIGFGVSFEWSKLETNQVSVHISESEDKDNEEEEYESREDLESGSVNGNPRPERKTIMPASGVSVILPVRRRNSQEEVYAGSHQYPCKGVYLLQFDNSYSLWRSKILYYRVYCTRQNFVKKN